MRVFKQHTELVLEEKHENTTTLLIESTCRVAINVFLILRQRMLGVLQVVPNVVVGWDNPTFDQCGTKRHENVLSRFTWMDVNAPLSSRLQPSNSFLK
jgi:hypothetical protein